MGPVTIWDSGDTGEVIDYHGTDLSPPLFPLYPTLLLPPSLAVFPRLLTHPIERALPTPEFIPGGCYGDAPSSEWRQGIQRRREL